MLDDYYAILGVSRTATPEEILQAYRQLVVKCHPDLQPNNAQAARLFRTLQRAFEVLQDPARRSQYDLQWLAAGESPAAPSETSLADNGHLDAEASDVEGSSSMSDKSRRTRDGKPRRSSRRYHSARSATDRNYNDDPRPGQKRRSRTRRVTPDASSADNPLSEFPLGPQKGKLWFALGVLCLVFLAGPAWLGYRWIATSGGLQRAQQLEAQGKYREAAEAAQGFVRFRPRHQAGVKALALNAERSADNIDRRAEAGTLLQNALVLAPDDPDLIRAFARNLLAGESPSRFAIAELHAGRLLELNDQDPDAWRIKAQAVDGQIDVHDDLTVRRAMDVHQTALIYNPSDVELTSRFAAICRLESVDDPTKKAAALGNKAMDALVQRNPRLPAALLARYRYRVAHGLPFADADLDMTLAVEPSLEARYLSGLRQLDRGEPARAVETLQSVVKEPSLGANAWRALALAQRLAGEPELALSTLQQGREAEAGQSAAAALISGSCHLALGKIDTARRDLAEAERLMLTETAKVEESQAADFKDATACLSAGIDLAKCDYEAAAPKLQRTLVRAFGQRRGGLASRRLTLCVAPDAGTIARLLARCFLDMGRPLEAIAIYSNLRLVDTTQPFTYLDPARIWLRLGRYELADELLTRAQEIPQLSDVDLLNLAWAQLALAQTLPAEHRQWQAIANTLARIQESGPLAANIAVLQASVHAAQGEPARSEELLAALAKTNPTSPQAARAIVELRLSQGRYAEVRQLLETMAAGIAKDELNFELLAAEGKLDEAYRWAQTQAADSSPEARLGWLRRMLAVALSRQDVAGAWTCVEESFVTARQAYVVRDAMCELPAWAYSEGPFNRCEAALRRLEGDGGASWRFMRGMKLLATASSPDDPAAQEAAKLEAGITQSRRTWTRKSLLRARLARLAGDDIQEIAWLRESLRLDETNLLSQRELYAALLRQCRAFEARELLDRLARVIQRQRSAAVSTTGSEPTSWSDAAALASARLDYKRRPEDPAARTWLAHLLLCCHKPQEAEPLLAGEPSAAESNAADAAAQLTLALAPDQSARLSSLIERLHSETSLAPRDRRFLLAQALMLAPDAAHADKVMVKLWVNQPARAGVAYLVAKHFAGRDVAISQEAIQATLSGAKGKKDGRALLAAALASVGQRLEWAPAWSVVFHTPRETVAAPEQFSERLVDLLLQGGANELDQALRLLRDRSQAGLSLTSDQQALHASLLGLRSETIEAEAIWSQLISERADDPFVLASYIDALLDHQRTDDAKHWLDRLESISPPTLSLLELKTRWLKQSKADARTIYASVFPGLRQVAEAAHPGKARVFACQRLANLVQLTGSPALAERWEAIATTINAPQQPTQ